MTGTLIDLPLLIAGMLPGWWLHRRLLATVWSRHAPATGADEAPYRRSEQQVPVAGAGRMVKVLVALIFACAFIGVVRVALAWVGIQDIVDRGHVRVHLVASDSRSAVLQVLIALQGLAAVIHFPAAARQLARREDGNATTNAIVTAAFGVVIGLGDAFVLRTNTELPVTYWVAGMIVDDVAYAIFSLVAGVALVLVARASRLAPPVAPAAAPPGGRSRVLAALRIGGSVATGALLTHAFWYATERNHVYAQIEGEEEVPVSGKPRPSKDGRYTVWMPEDTLERPDTFETPRGKLDGTSRLFLMGPTKLRLSTFERDAEDQRPIEAFCPTDEHDLRIVREDGVESCQTHYGGDARRVVLFERTIYVLTATPVPSKAGDFFLSSFRINRKPK